MVNINLDLTEISSGLDNFGAPHGERTQIDGPECWLFGVSCDCECAIGVGTATGRQYAAVLRPHVAGAECPYRHSGIDAELLSQARRRWVVEGGSLSSASAIFHRSISSIYKRDRPQTPLVKVSIGQGRGSTSREPVFGAGTCLITSTPRSAACTACATIVISGTEIRCCPIRPHWIPQPRVRADVHVPMGARMIGTGSCSCCDPSR
jgi:hypothetical protein